MVKKPLALRMRPNHIDEIIGQSHLLGKDKMIRRMVEAGHISSMILYGPPEREKLRWHLPSPKRWICLSAS